MRRVTSAAVVALALACVAAAPAGDSSPQFQTVAAQDAETKFDAAKRKAKEQYDAAMKAAAQQAIADFAKAKTAVMKAGNLDEANRIQAAVDAIKTDATSAATYTVVAGKGWQNGGEARVGDRLHIAATGTWCADTAQRAKFTMSPDGDGKEFGLFARINSGPIFRVGSGATITAKTNGPIEFVLAGGKSRNNDDGEVTVTVARE